MLSWGYGAKPKIQTTQHNSFHIYWRTLSFFHLMNPSSQTCSAVFYSENHCCSSGLSEKGTHPAWVLSLQHKAHFLRLPRGWHWDVWAGVLPLMTCVTLHWLDREPRDWDLFIILLWIHQICFEVRRFVLPFCLFLQELLAVSEPLLYLAFENCYRVWYEGFLKQGNPPGEWGFL